MKYNYQDAEQHCQSLSERGRPAHLVSILDEEENQFVAQFTEPISNKNIQLWIGYNDLEVEGVYTWIDGSPAGYESWRSSYPDKDKLGNPDCILTFEKLWKDLACSLERYSVCKMEGYSF